MINSNLVSKLFKKLSYSKSGCWEWTGAVTVTGNGYGIVRSNGIKYLTHRLSYQIFIADIPEGLSVLHRCDNRKCVNPDHLFLGTHLDNMRDKMQKGRCRPGITLGISQPMAKLNDQQILAIRDDMRYQKIIAEEYGVTQGKISAIKRRKAWKHVEPPKGEL